MSDTTIIEATPAQGSGRTPFSWSAAIAGAIAAAAVTFIIAALGSGIGLPFASPYSSGPSATSLTVAAAVWLVMAQAIGFATGGYLAGRLRNPLFDGAVGERTFRDNKIGDIKDVLVDREGKVTALIIGVGGFLGAGEKDVAVPFNAVRVTTKNNNNNSSSNKWYLVMNSNKDIQIRPQHHDLDAGRSPRDHGQPE